MLLLGKSSLIEYVKAYNGRKQILVSVYAFDRFRNRKPVVQSAYIDLLYCKGQPEEMLRYVNLLDLEQYKYVSRYDGAEIDIIAPLSKVYNHIDIPLDIVKSKVNIPFSRKTWELMTWYRTWNPKTKRYVIHVVPGDTVEELDELSKNPVKRERESGERYIDGN